MIVGKQMAFAEALFLLQKPYFGLRSASLPLENCQKQFWPSHSEAPNAKVKGEVSSPDTNLLLLCSMVLICALTVKIPAEPSE